MATATDTLVPDARATPATAGQRDSFDLVEKLFVLGAFLAPLMLFVVKSLTVYDLLVLGIAVLMGLGRRRLEPMPSVLVAAGWVFVVAALASAFRATHPLEALTQTAQFAFIWFVLLPVVITLGRSMRVVRWSLVMFVMGSFVTVLVAMQMQATQGADRMMVYYTENPNRLGYPSAYLLPFVAFFVVDWWRTGRRARAVAATVVMGYLMIWALAASASRGATVGALVAVLVYFVLRPGSSLLGVMVRLAVAAVAAFATFKLMVATGLFAPTLVDRVMRTFDGENSETLVQDRSSLARAGLSAFEQSPFVGTGLDNFRYVATLYADGTTLQVPHNLWIQFLAQVGLFGTLAFFVIVAWWFVRMYAAHRATTHPGTRRLMWAFIASLASIMTIFMTIPILNDRHYWLLIGLGLAVALHHSGGARTHDEPDPAGAVRTSNGGAR